MFDIFTSRRFNSMMITCTHLVSSSKTTSLRKRLQFDRSLYASEVSGGRTCESFKEDLAVEEIQSIIRLVSEWAFKYCQQDFSDTIVEISIAG